MTHIELENYVRTLEARVTEQDKLLAVMRQVVDSMTIASKPLDAAKLAENVKQIESGRGMCPHCGVKPNHFFHVKTCAAKNKKNNGQKETPS
jgi:uncharacterized coiled-coil protein SlyX